MTMAVLTRVALASRAALRGHEELLVQIQDFLLPLAILGPAFAQRVGGVRLLALWLDVATSQRVPLDEYTATAIYQAVKRYGDPFIKRLAQVPRVSDAVLAGVVGRAALDDARELLTALKEVTDASLPARVAYDVAAARGNLDLIMWLGQNGYKQSSTLKALAWAAQCGSLDVVQWLTQQGINPEAVRGMMDKAACHGHLHIVEWLCENAPPASWSDLAVGIAVEDDQLEIADYLIQKSRAVNEGNTPRLKSALTAIFSDGDLEKLTWLHERGLLLTNVKRKHIELAKTRGHVSILQFLTNQFPGQFDEAMEFTGRNAEGGSIEVAKWAYERNQLQRSLSCVYAAARHGHLEFVRWYVATMDGMDMQFFPDYLAVPVAAMQGHLECVQFLVETGWGEVSDEAIQGAASRGHMRVLRWLIGSTRLPAAKGSSMLLAAAHGHLEAVECLFSSGIVADVGAVVPAAAKGHVEVVRWMVRQFPQSKHNETALSAAVSEGRLRIVRLLPWHNISYRDALIAQARDHGHVDIAKWIEKYR